MEITLDQRRQLTDSSLMFLRAVGNVYGSDRAMEMWGQLADTVTPELKCWVFEAMLLGRMGSTMTINKFSQFSNKLGVIKAIRTYDRRMLGLKEAKDMYDLLQDSGKEIILEISPEKTDAAAREFRTLGCQGLGII